MKEEINGLMFVRHAGDKSILVAVIERPKKLLGEVQHVFTGTAIQGRLHIATTGETIDISELAKGNTPDGLLMEPIWRT